MEFLEYYHIIRSRIWLAFTMAAIVLVVVTVYQMLPPSRWQAEGRITVDPGMADMQVRREGDRIEFAHDRDFWGTLEQFVGLRAIVEAAAREVGISNPDELNALTVFDYDRAKRGSVFSFRGTAASPKQAEELTNAGMEYLAKFWNQSRAATATALRKQLASDVVATDKRIAALRERLSQGESNGGLAGRPADLLTWTQGQINALQGAIATTKVDIGVAQDRLHALHGLARREESLPPEQRLLGGPPNSLVGAMQTRLVQLETERLQMLDTRTPTHPKVVALDQQIELLRARIAEESKTQTSTGPAIPTVLRDQITTAELDHRAAQRRLAAFTTEEAALRQRIPGLQKLAYEYGAVEAELATLSAKRAACTDSLALIDSEIQRLKTSQDLKVTSKAQALPSPKKLSRYVMMAVAGTFAGFVMGCMLIFMLHYVDLTFKNEAEAESLLGYPVLAGIPRSNLEVVSTEAEQEPPPDTATEEGVE